MGIIEFGFLIGFIVLVLIGFIGLGVCMIIILYTMVKTGIGGYGGGYRSLPMPSEPPFLTKEDKCSYAEEMRKISQDSIPEAIGKDVVYILDEINRQAKLGKFEYIADYIHNSDKLKEKFIELGFNVETLNQGRTLIIKWA